ncbi:MAG: D-alanyl-D-alanine carboxypeptidase [Clostridia bacterium]|nr:D-alanyl-D-alanine carboxypeptidase [Clostridia bacterium]
MKLKKRIILLLLSFILVTMPVFATETETAVITEATPVDLKLPCKSAILIEQTTGQVLYANNQNEKLPIASVTKIMTLLLTMEALESGIISLDENVPISENAASMGGSQAYLEVGEAITLHDVLKAVFVSSANDGAVALAEMISGSVEGFVATMNEKAASLGMHDTIFYNPTGLDDGDTNLSTANDVAIMSKALLQYDKIYDYTTIWIDSIRDGAFGLSNTNKLIRFYPGATGLKTGSTAKAKFCVSASAERNGLKLCAVVLAGESSADRFSAAKTLLDYGFANFAFYTPSEVNLTPIPVWDGLKEETTLTADVNGILLPKTSAGGIETEVIMESELFAPVEKGQTVGKILYRKGNDIVFESPILTAESVDKISFSQILRRLLLLFFTGSTK